MKVPSRHENLFDNPSADGNNYRQIFSLFGNPGGWPEMSQNKEPLSFEEIWALAVKAVNRRIGDARAKRLLVDKKLAKVIETCVSETPLPQLQTLSWLRDILLRLTHSHRKSYAPMTERPAAEYPLKHPAKRFKEKEECGYQLSAIAPGTVPTSAKPWWKTASVGDTKYAAEKLAAITLAALRLQERDPDPTLDARLVATWNEMRFVIEENIQSTLRKREEALEESIREGRANVAECHTRLMACYRLEHLWRSYAERLRECDDPRPSEDDWLVKTACFEVCADQLRVALHTKL